MDDVILTRALRAAGLDSHDIRRMQRRGELFSVRRGAFHDERHSEQTVEVAHRELVAATVPQLGADAVVSHVSAAVLHGMPVWAERLARVHVTRSRSGGGQRRSVVHVHGAPYGPDDIVVVNGIPVTSMARTVLDLARSLPMDEAVAAGDQALAKGLDRAALDLCLSDMEQWPGVRRARRAVGFLDGDSESPGESVSRVRLADEGLPRPVLQRDVVDDAGRLIGRVDFCWDEQRTVGEFDGRDKYGRFLAPGRSVEDAVLAEKRREDALRDHGWQVVRWMWGDLYRRGVLRDRLRRAFARATPSPR